MEKEIIEKAREVVLKAEDDYVCLLFNALARYENTNCDCPQCKKRPKTISNELSKELDRIAPQGFYDEETRELPKYNEEDFYGE